MQIRSGILVVAVILFAGWAGFAQVKEKPRDKTPAPKQVPEVAKPAVDASKKQDAAAPAGKKQNPSGAESAENEDEEAIRKSAAAFITAYNAHDAKKVSELFAIKAEFTDEDGNLIKGRDAIAESFEQVFRDNPHCKIGMEIGSIRALTPNIAVEEGIVRGQPVPEQSENVSSYLAVHVKIDGHWVIASVKDYEMGPQNLTAKDHLEELNWLVGEWIEESPDTVVHSLCRWHDNDHFLMQEFKVQIEGHIAMSGTMRIGWDAVKKQLKSWVFDSHGGHADGYWLHHGDEWIVKTQGATAAGESASATNVYRQIDDDTMGWRSFDRVIDGEPQPDIDEIIIKRKPPSPMQ